MGVGVGADHDPVGDRPSAGRRRLDPKRRRVMSAQNPYLEVDAIGVLPTLMLLAVMLLTALGIVAHVALL
jgi:hypothetical protein